MIRKHTPLVALRLPAVTLHRWQRDRHHLPAGKRDVAVRQPVSLGVSGALSNFAPIQPLIGAASVGLLAATLAWRLRARAVGCERCAV